VTELVVGLAAQKDGDQRETRRDHDHHVAKASPTEQSLQGRGEGGGESARGDRVRKSR
jgi:hypothetical protein